MHRSWIVGPCFGKENETKEKGQSVAHRPRGVNGVVWDSVSGSKFLAERVRRDILDELEKLGCSEALL